MISLANSTIGATPSGQADCGTNVTCCSSHARIPPAELHKVLASGRAGGMLDSSAKSRIFSAESALLMG